MRLSSSPEIAILSRVVHPEAGDWKPSVAKELLKLRFSESDRAYMRELLAKNSADTLSEAERREMAGFEIVGHLLDLIHSKARRSIKSSAKA